MHISLPREVRSQKRSYHFIITFRHIIYLLDISTDYFESIIFKINITTFISHHSNDHFTALRGCLKSYKCFVCLIDDTHFDIQLCLASAQRLLSAFEQAYLCILMLHSGCYITQIINFTHMVCIYVNL